jgi:hypothetical protein
MNRLFHADDDSVTQIRDQLARLRAAQGLSGASPFSREQLSLLLETAFWASLESNETRATRVCVSVACSSGGFSDAIAFESPVPYHESQIARLAPAVPQGGCLLVSEGLHIWGFGRDRTGGRPDTVTVDIWEPGTLRVGMGVFQPFAILRGRSNSVLSVTSMTLADYLERLLSRSHADDFWNRESLRRECLVLRDLARVIVAQGHGAIVLIVPAPGGGWATSLEPFPYRFAVPDVRVRDAIRLELDETRARGEMFQQISEAAPSVGLMSSLMQASVPRSRDIVRHIEAIASLAGVDGAIVITRELQVLGFGAKIASAEIPPVHVFDATPGTRDGTPAALEDLGGTRHQSAARFAGAHKDAVVLVFSQDRHLSVMHWDSSIDAVSVVRHAEWWV